MNNRMNDSEVYVTDDIELMESKVESGEVDFVVLELEKSDIIHCNFNKLFKVISVLDKRKDRGYMKLMLFIDGYNDVIEELYEIDRVRRFFNKLIRKVPHFLFYICPENEMHLQILCSVSDLEKFYHGEMKTSSEWMEVLKKGGEIPQHEIKIMMDKKIKELIIDGLVKHKNKTSIYETQFIIDHIKYIDEK